MDPKYHSLPVHLCNPDTLIFAHDIMRGHEDFDSGEG